MSFVGFSSKGDLSETSTFLKRLTRTDIEHKLERFGKQGVEQLQLKTPVRTGKTRDSWSYSIERTADSVILQFNNDNINRTIPVVKLIEDGHAARDGTWVPGHPFVKRTIAPIFKEAEIDIWKEVTD